MHLFLPLAHTLKHVGSKVVVLHILNALFNDFSQVVRLGAPRMRGKEIKPLLCFWS